MAIPKHWQSTRLSEVLSECDDRCGTLSVPVLSVTKTRGLMLASERFGRVMHGKNLAAYRLARRGTLVADPMLLWDGSIGIQDVVDAGAVSPDYRVYCVSDQLDLEYLRNLIRSPSMIRRYQDGARGTNVRRNRITRDDFLAIPFERPPLPEQKKIAAILSSVDEVIAKTEAVIAQLQIVKKAMMEQLLTKGMPGRHTRFKQTEIGEIPEEWEVVSLERAASRIVVGVVIQPASYYVPDGIPALRSLNVKDDEILLDKLVFFSDASNQQLSKSQIRTGDVLTVRTGVPGVSACVPAALNGANCIDLIITTPSAALRGEFLSRFINSDRGRGAILKRQGGLAQQHFNVGEMKQLLVPIPSIEEQDLIIERLQVIDARLGVERALAKAITIVKAALSSSLLSGELRVIPEVAE